MATEDDDTGLSVLVDSVLKRKGCNFDRGHEVTSTIDRDLGNSCQNITNFAALSDVELNSVASLRHDSDGVLGVLLQLSITDVSRGLFLTFPTRWRKVTIPVEL